MKSSNDLQLRLARVGRVFDLPAVLARPTENQRSISKYYKVNRLAYSLFHSRAGFVHFALSAHGKFKPDDFLAQARTVEAAIEEIGAGSVLELGSGKAANLLYLATRYPDAKFFGIDLPNGQQDVRRADDLSNLELREGDYHDLSAYADNSMDVVFAVETLCHAAGRRRVLSEARRVLRPGGRLIVFDGYFARPDAQLTADELLCLQLIYKGMMVTVKDRSYTDFREDLAHAKLKLQVEQNLNAAVLPSMKRLEKRAAQYLNHPHGAAMLKKVMPDEFLGNTISGYLFPTAIEHDIFHYYLTVAEK